MPGISGHPHGPARPGRLGRVRPDAGQRDDVPTRRARRRLPRRLGRKFGQTTPRTDILRPDTDTYSKHSSFSPRNLVAKRASVDQDNFNMMKSFYNSCMNQTELKRVGIAPGVSRLNDVIKIVPVEEAA